ncbi:SMP-30/gluconolactonase/LRE family protein [Sphingomonas sp. Tas61C01]|uniref:SMP-30/gluconolactonase/LRE family protein n=1 Tax=Sphingomonas sp. Tas61C01 TaxID=3458297 RepID=UPI00403E546B
MSIGRRGPVALEGGSLRCVWPGPCRLGEAPVWDHRIGVLHFVDLKRGAIHSLSSGGEVGTLRLGGLATALSLTSSPRILLCATDAGIERVSLDTGARQVVFGPIATGGAMRTNDGACDARGSFWIGVMDDSERSFEGTLYRLRAGEGPEPKLEHVGVSNGLGWSPDGSVFYFTDSLRREIYRFAFDEGTGDLGGRELFARFPEGTGAPDGLAVDEEGYVWSAIWDGWRIVRFAPDGSVDREVAVPVPRPTSLAFGGSGLTDLYVTSATIGLSPADLDAAPLSGALFVLDPGVRGMAANIVGSLS